MLIARVLTRRGRVTAMRLGPGATPLTVGATLPRTWAGSGWRLSGRVQTLSGVTSMVAGDEIEIL